MNVIFITLSNINSIEERNIYADLLRKFRDEGHSVYIVSPSERRNGKMTHLIEEENVNILKVRTLNIQKTNVVEKGIGTLMIEGQFKRAIKKHFHNTQFDLILYSTPPITFTNVVRYLKRRNPQAISYLLLKDIFPQNAVDMGMLSPSLSLPSREGNALPKPSPRGKGLINLVMAWPKYLLYKHFRKKEIALYKVSDHIGCMSPANVEFVLRNNPEIARERVEVAPNSIELRPLSGCPPSQAPQSLTPNLRLPRGGEGNLEIREKYGLPTDKPIFIYGGNLGRPQGIPFLIKCLEANKNRKDCHFLIVGNGTEYSKLHAWYSNLNDNENHNVTLMQRLPKEDYDQLVRSCDVGLIFLDHRFTIPNYPSRLLSYLEYKMPVICATDPNTDIGRIAEENGYGLWCESVKPESFTALVDKMLASDRKAMGERGYEYLKNNYLVDNTYNAIMRHV